MVELVTIIIQVIVLLFMCSDVVCCIIPHGAVNMSCTIKYFGIIPQNLLDQRPAAKH